MPSRTKRSNTSTVDDRGTEGQLIGDDPVDVPSDRCPRCGGRVEPDWEVCGWCGRRTGDAYAAVTEAPVVHELAVGALLEGRYRIGALLGRGGFGITYRARDTRLGRDVAIKELFPPGAFRHGDDVGVVPDDRDAFAEALDRFQREATSLARFNHPGIVQIFEVFEANRTAYLVMELIGGPSVGQVLVDRGAPFGVDEVLDVVQRAGGALGAVHAAGLLHRDINPSNIMVDGTRRIVLIDFGLARRFGDDVSGKLTRAVTPGYAPPEQYAGSTAAGPSCDVFGLAATAYKLLTGRTPTNVFDRQAGGELPAPHVLRPEVPPLVSAAILDGMELDPAHRPAGTDAFLNRLGLFGSTPGSRVLVGVSTPVADPSPPPEPEPAPAPEPPSTFAPGPGVVTPALGAVGHRPPARASIPPPVPVAPAAAPVRAVAAPWHDGAPAVIGPGGRWRGWVTWPAGIAVAVLTSASPLLVGAVLAWVGIPLLATVGDREVARHRVRTGTARRLDDTSTTVFYPLRYLRNLAVGIARSLAAIAVAAIGVATEAVLVDGAVEPVVRDLTIRCTGVAMALVLLLPARDAGRGFRTDAGIDALADRVMQGRRRPGARVAVVWFVALAVTAVAASMPPELWPLG